MEVQYEASYDIYDYICEIDLANCDERISGTLESDGYDGYRGCQDKSTDGSTCVVWETVDPNRFKSSDYPG